MEKPSLLATLSGCGKSREYQANKTVPIKNAPIMPKNPKTAKNRIKSALVFIRFNRVNSLALYNRCRQTLCQFAI
ncbi:MAG: hypothetical protein AAB580_01545, partial [Patescibacteria group bacterium]